MPEQTLKPKPKPEKVYVFEDNKGKMLHIPAKTTIEDLVRYGVVTADSVRFAVTSFRICEPEKPIEEGWFRSNGACGEM